MNAIIIYKVTNLINKKVYIGQTIHSLEKRKKRHYSDAKRLKYYFYNALNKYSKNDFKWEILIKCKSVKEMNMWEKYYINLYNSTNKCKGYNSREGGRNGALTTEVKIKISKKAKGKKQTKMTQIKKVKSQIQSKHCKKVLCINSNKIYNNISHASRELNLDRTNVSRVCNNEKAHTKGYEFKFI